ncbi:MAG: glycosyltransferase [Victivallaceae bacterium]|nr:glycosyltransferase [Victivallaceae bacterium]
MESKRGEINFVSVVVPVYNEEGCLQQLIDRTLAALDKCGKKFEFIMVDDGSRDSSVEIMRKAAESRPDQVIACILNRNYGQHSAIMAGFSLVRGDLVITLDADLQNPPEEIANLIAAAEKGNDVVGTVRQNRQDTLFRRWASKLVNFVAMKTTGVDMCDYGCMLRAYRRRVVDAMLMCNERSTFIPILANTFAHNTCEIPVQHAERAVGESKYSLLKLINLQFNLLTCMTTAPLRVLTYFGVMAAGCGFLLSIYIVARRLIQEEHDVWTNGGTFTLFAVLFFFTGVQMIGIGVIGEYIGRIYTDVRSRPRYFVEEIVGRKSGAEDPQA